MLLYLLVADLARFVVAAERAGDMELVDRSLAAVERLFVEGDEQTTELFAVSFVEHLGAETEPGEAEVVRRFPSELSAELRRQRNWRPT